MPPKRSSLSRRTHAALRRNHDLASQSVEQQLQRNELTQQRSARSRSRQTPKEQEANNENDGLRMRSNREVRDRSDDSHLQQISADQIRIQTRGSRNFQRVVFNYDTEVDYSTDNKVQIGLMNVGCLDCKGYTFPKEPRGLCCANGKVNLPILNPPPEPLKSLILGTGLTIDYPRIFC